MFVYAYLLNLISWIRSSRPKMSKMLEFLHNLHFLNYLLLILPTWVILKKLKHAGITIILAPPVNPVAQIVNPAKVVIY